MVEITSPSFESAAHREFRQEVRQWLAKNLPTGWGTAAFQPPRTEDGEHAFLLDWKRRLYAGGWAGLSWPKEYGGRGATLMEQAIFFEENVRVSAPADIGTAGTGYVGPMIIDEGSEEQKKRYLKPILTGEEIWCQGFSEPNAGSDLASLRTRAVRDGDRFVVNGQKVWTSGARRSQLMILLARTDTEVPKHKGISGFIVSMDSPGLDVRSISQINGASEFCEVFFDNVSVPAENVVGRINQGWQIAQSTLSHERFTLTRAFEVQFLLKNLVQSACQPYPGRTDRPIDDPSVRLQLADLYCEAHAARCAYYQSINRHKVTGTLGYDMQMGKLHTSELTKRISDTAISILGTAGVMGEVAPRLGGEVAWYYQFVNTFRNTIAGGTSQVLRNVLGDRVLELPR